ncbi:hypothetical protein BP6252_10104 [Coleophoma cylindrospora]|uniref:Uncharacterized protein n=1 Tax=Coleophoma cylindrospora TaxID=1849047 RepID=A0A3D8QXG9_9HELO|nr:hypothetical protein BP6252_10104 [Coleophoma cylindrospora]
MFDPNTNCTNAPSQTASDAGVAGAGVLLSFIVTAGLALVLSLWIILQEIRRHSEAKIARKLLLSFSDQQIITGIGLQSIGLAKADSMVSYHFFIIWMLASISTATHSAALLALFNDFKRDWVLRWLRHFLMFVNLVLSLVYAVFILKDVTGQLAPTLAVQCVWSSNSQTESRSNMTLSVVGTIAVMVGQCLVFALAVWYLHSGSQKWLQPLRVLSMIILMIIGIGATIRVIFISQAFGTPSVALSDDGEKAWNFGQLLALLLLLLPLISAVEIFRGEMKVPSPVVDDDDQKPLFAQAVNDGFEPNPFWNSQIRMKNIK